MSRQFPIQPSYGHNLLRREDGSTSEQHVSCLSWRSQHHLCMTSHLHPALRYSKKQVVYGVIGNYSVFLPRPYTLLSWCPTTQVTDVRRGRGSAKQCLRLWGPHGTSLPGPRALPSRRSNPTSWRATVSISRCLTQSQDNLEASSHSYSCGWNWAPLNRQLSVLQNLEGPPQAGKVPVTQTAAINSLLCARRVSDEDQQNESIN